MKKKQFFSGNKQHLKTILCLQGLSSELFVWLRIKMTSPQLKTNLHRNYVALLSMKEK